MSYIVISTLRPLPLGAENKLEKFNIVKKENQKKPGKWTTIEVEKKPPKELLKSYDLKLEGDKPKEIWEGVNSTEVLLIYEDRVENGSGDKLSMSPKEARKQLEESPEFREREKPITEEIGIF